MPRRNGHLLTSFVPSLPALWRYPAFVPHRRRRLVPTVHSLQLLRNLYSVFVSSYTHLQRVIRISLRDENDCRTTALMQIDVRDEWQVGAPGSPEIQVGGRSRAYRPVMRLNVARYGRQSTAGLVATSQSPDHAYRAQLMWLYDQRRWRW